jgi:hypothetical protein
VANNRLERLVRFVGLDGFVRLVRFVGLERWGC